MKYTAVDTPATVKLVRYSGDDKVVVDSARVSFASIDEMHKRVEGDDRECTERDIRLIKYLAQHKHMSPFEHCHMTFWVEVPLYIARQHMRHRTWSYNEVSRRYTSEGIRIYEPCGYRPQAKSNKQGSYDRLENPAVYVTQGTIQSYETNATDVVRKTNKQLVDTYHSLLEAGVCREQARGILPQSLMTQYYATVNLRNLVAFIKERCGDDAQYEIRCLARQMRDKAQKIFPISTHHLLGVNNV